jgi:protein-disulfide isomerase
MKISIFLFSLLIFSCAPKPETTFNLVSPPPNTPPEVVAKINGDQVLSTQLVEGIEVDLFEHEEKIFNLKMDKLKVLMTEKFMNMDPRKKGITNDDYFEKYIAKNISPSKSDMDQFIKSRGITSDQLNPELLPKIETYLKENLKKNALESWLEEQSVKYKVEIYLKKPQRPVFDVKIGNSPSLGDKNAKITIVAYSDYQCPFSKKGSEILKELRDSYGDKVKIVHKDFPLPFHSRAKEMAQGALCANEQSNKSFWNFYYKLFENQMVPNLDDISKEVGLDQGKFTKCINSKKYEGQIEEEIKEAIKLGIKSTPTFFINGKIINGAHNIEVFKSLIDEEIKLN